MEIWLMRHPPVDVPVGTCYGRLDVPIIHDWREAALKRKTQLPNLDNFTVYSSPSSRCLLLAQFLVHDPVTDSRLFELDFGVWEDKLWRDLTRPELRGLVKRFRTCRAPWG